jgi:hypothetical protein
MRYQATRVSDGRTLQGTIDIEDASQAMADVLTFLPKSSKPENNQYDVVLTKNDRRVAKERMTVVD